MSPYQLARTHWLFFAVLFAACDDRVSPPPPAQLQGSVLEATGEPIAAARIGLIYFDLRQQARAASIETQHAARRREPGVVFRPSDRVLPQGVVHPVGSDTTRLFANYPNPFERMTSIRFEVFEVAEIRLDVRAGDDIVRTILHRSLPPGAHLVVWDGRSDRGDDLANGLYALRLTVGATPGAVVYERGMFLQSVSADDFLRAFNATTDANGRFVIALEELPIGEEIALTNALGDSLGSAAVPSRIRICAVRTDVGARSTRESATPRRHGTMQPPFVCVDVELGNLQDDVSVTLQFSDVAVGPMGRR